MTLIAHRGGWEATPADLACVPVPEDTDTWKAVPYPRLIEEVKLHIPRFGLAVEDERYALARDGNQMFGVLTCQNGHVSDWGLAIGIRSSYDVLAVDLVLKRGYAKPRPHGETGFWNTVNVFRDLPDLMHRCCRRSRMKRKLGRRDRVDETTSQTRRPTIIRRFGGTPYRPASSRRSSSSSIPWWTTPNGTTRPGRCSTPSPRSRSPAPRGTRWTGLCDYRRSSAKFFQRGSDQSGPPIKTQKEEGEPRAPD